MSALAAAGLAPERLELEITERLILDNSIETADILRQRPGLGLGQGHQRRLDDHRLVEAEAEGLFHGVEGVAAAVRIAREIRLAHAADQRVDTAPVSERGGDGEILVRQMQLPIAHAHGLQFLAEADITVGPLMKAWGFFRGDGRMPSDAELAIAPREDTPTRLIAGEHEARSGVDPMIVPMEIFRIAETPVLLAIPLFTFAGYLMAESKTPDRLVRAASSALGIAFGWPMPQDA